MSATNGAAVANMSFGSNTVDADDIDDVNLETKDTMTLLNEYIDEVDIAVDKSSLKSVMRSLYIESCNIT